MNHPPIIESITSFRFAPEQWLWCLHCERFFQGRDARPDGVGGVQGCAFTECDGAGYGVDVFDWDAWARSEPAVLARWPAERALRKGLHAAGWPTAEALDACDPWESPPPEPGFTRNQDVPRRDAILRLAAPGPGRAPRAFTGLDLRGLALLVYERLLAPWDRHPFGPPISKCLRLLADFPELTISGRVFPVAAAENGVAPESVACDLAGLSHARRDAVCHAVACSCVEGGEWEETDARIVGRWRRSGST